MPDPRRVSVRSLWREITFGTTVPLAISLQTRSFVPDRRHITALPCGARVMNCAWMVPGPSVEKEIARVIPFGSRFESSLRSTNVSVAVGSDPGSDWLSGLDPAKGDALAFEPGDVAADAGADEAGAEEAADPPGNGEPGPIGPPTTDGWAAPFTAPPL